MSSPRSGSGRRGSGCATHSRVPRPRGTSRSSRTGHSRSATRRSPSTCCSTARTSCSTPAWRRGASPAGSRCTWPTSSASVPRSTGASSATGCSRSPSHSAGCPPLGGVLCERCPGPPSGRAGLSLEALKLLKAYQRLDIEALASLRLAEQTEREVEASLRDFLRISLERDARSLAFLDEVRERHAQIAASLAPAADEPSFRDQRAAQMEGGAGGAERAHPQVRKRAPHAPTPQIGPMIADRRSPACSISIWVRLDAGVAAARATSSARAATPG